MKRLFLVKTNLRLDGEVLDIPSCAIIEKLPTNILVAYKDKEYLIEKYIVDYNYNETLAVCDTLGLHQCDSIFMIEINMKLMMGTGRMEVMNINLHDTGSRELHIAPKEKTLEKILDDKELDGKLGRSRFIYGAENGDFYFIDNIVSGRMTISELDNNAIRIANNNGVEKLIVNGEEYNYLVYHVEFKTESGKIYEVTDKKPVKILEPILDEDDDDDDYHLNHPHDYKNPYAKYTQNESDE